MRDVGVNILLAHGSPDSRHRQQVEALASRVAVELGDDVRAAFLDDAKIPAGSRVLPLFLGDGRHAREDTARFADKFSGILLPPLAEAAGRLADMGVSMAASSLASREPVIFAFYRFRRFERLVAAVYARRKGAMKMSMAALHGAPDCVDMLRFWQGEGAKRLALQPMLLFGGQSLAAMAGGMDAFGMQVTFGQPLAAHAGMPCLVADCLRGVA